MELLGTHVPISWPTLLILACGLLLAGPVGRWLGALPGWRRGAATVTWLALSAIVAFTIPPERGGPADPGHCLPDSATQVWSDPLHTSGGVGGGLLNVLLFLPLGAALVVASGRAWIAVIVVLGLPAVIEVAQRSIPGRLCSFSDYMTNSAGGLAGVIVGALVLIWHPSSTMDSRR